ncbi:MAG: PIG-L family deacetylase [Acidimicrobiales bacterium]
MATLVCFHAHPDDESIATGGTMIRASEDGHDVVLVVATDGSHGEVAPGLLEAGETLAERRHGELLAAAEILGVGRVEMLGYRDSGMMGEPTNELEGSFWTADVATAAERLAVILRDVGADVLTIYDDHGGYGHPDHIQVHRVGTRAAELAGVERVFWATMNRDHLRRGMEANPDFRESFDDESRETVDSASFGMAEDDITHAVDVRAHLEAKRAAMAAHASQIDEASFFLTLPAAAFADAFGTEWFVAPGVTREDGFVGDLFDGLPG